MKSLLVLSILALSNVAGAATFKDLVGSYKISNPNFPVLTLVIIAADSTIQLTEKSVYGTLECSGTATLVKNILTSNVECVDGQKFSQRINLSKVKKFDKFSAPVYSTLYQQEIEMDFERN
jgi:hypothetical protein